MKIPAICLVMALILAAGARVGLAEGNDTRLSPDEPYKIKSKRGEVRVRDKSKPVRRALEKQYAAIAQAYYRDDPTVVLALRTPNFAAILPTGERFDSDQSAAYVRAGFDQVERTLKLSFDIQTLTVRGDTAVAVIHQHWKRLQQKAGQLRTVETEAVQREWWLNTEVGWRIFLVDDVHPGVWVVDGKRVDPARPYDPNAPEFKPGTTRSE
jgi:hypothetical protein